jgi:hypothetical protein
MGGHTYILRINAGSLDLAISQSSAVINSIFEPCGEIPRRSLRENAIERPVKNPWFSVEVAI